MPLLEMTEEWHPLISRGKDLGISVRQGMEAYNSRAHHKAPSPGLPHSFQNERKQRGEVSFREQSQQMISLSPFPRRLERFSHELPMLRGAPKGLKKVRVFAGEQFGGCDAVLWRSWLHYRWRE